MADNTNTKVLIYTGRRLVMQFTNVSDGTGESLVTKVDISDYEHPSIPGKFANRCAINKVIYSTAGMGVTIFFDSTATDQLALSIPADVSDTLCYTEYGGIKSDPDLVGLTGDIKFSTVGHTSGDTYSIVMELAVGFDQDD